MDSLESIILVLIILCIIILFKIKSNRKIEGFGCSWYDVPCHARAIAEALRKALELIYIAFTLGLLVIQMPWLVPKFLRDGGKSAERALIFFHRTISVYIQRVRRFGFDTYSRTKKTIDKYFNLAINTVKHSAAMSVDKVLKIFSSIVKKITKLFNTELINSVSKGMKEVLSQVKNTMKYATKTIINTLMNIKKQAIILFHQILNDTNKNINKFTREINQRFKLILGSTYAKIQPYIIFISAALFLLIGGGIFSYFYFSSSEDINEVNNIND
jgi:hypothetical protein